MSIRALAGKAIRTLLDHGGYVLLKPSVKFGIDPFVDINRLGSAWRLSFDVFFDVGANDGDTVVSALKHFPRARIFSFEPHPSTFSVLTRRVGANAQFSGFNLALGSETGSRELIEYDETRLNSLIPDAQYAVRFGREIGRTTVECTTLDNFCRNNAIELIDVLKIDTEGSDLSVLQGGLAMLKKGAIRFIYVEFNDLRPKVWESGALMPIDDLLRPWGYRFVSTYLDSIILEGGLLTISNALFALPPR
jgi:FkbM family methyltransferase